MRTNWALDPYDLEKLAYCFDPSSERTLEYLRQRTRRIMERYRPSLLKLDFSYGLPGPDACAPRDPQWRGERWGHKLLLTIAEAAKAVMNTTAGSTLDAESARATSIPSMPGMAMSSSTRSGTSDSASASAASPS